MGKEKAGFLTPKAIGNRIKAKGLQKLRWYCQMCNKQCRDENGFKCHCTSESHQRQMQMFTENSGRYMDEFSVAFEEGMLEIISRKARSHRVQANVLYRDYIADRNHTHMNSTIWETLTDFVMYLGRTGKCEVDETEKGWFVTYIDRDPEKLRRLEERAKRERTELDSEERHERDLLRQAKVAREAAGEEALAPAATELRRDHPEQKVTLAIGGAGKGKPKLASCSAFGDTGEEEPPGDGGAAGPGASSCSSGAGAASGVPQGGTSGVPKGGKAPAIASLMAEETRRKESAGRKDYWVAPGLVVKVLNKKLKEGKYYKQKGTVEQVVDRYTARVRIHATGDLIQLDQDELETVIPKEGSRVRIVNGAHRGATAQLLSLNVDEFCVSVKISDGAHAGRVIDRVQYEDVCKLDASSTPN